MGAGVAGIADRKCDGCGNFCGPHRVGHRDGWHLFCGAQVLACLIEEVAIDHCEGLRRMFLEGLRCQTHEVGQVASLARVPFGVSRGRERIGQRGRMWSAQLEWLSGERRSCDGAVALRQTRARRQPRGGHWAQLLLQ